MSQGDPSEGSEDVTDFLRRIKELSDKRDREDAERTRKLEEEIMEGRRQREARRAERARSLSPEKQSPSGTPRPANLSKPDSQFNLRGSSTVSISNDHPSGSTPQLSRNTWETSKMRVPNPQIPSPKNEFENNATDTMNHDNIQTPSSTSSPGFSKEGNTLLWQQRPSSIRESRSRPVSLIGRTTSPGTHSKIRTDDADTSRANSADTLGAEEVPQLRSSSDHGARFKGTLHNEDELEETTYAALRGQNMPQISKNALRDMNVNGTRAPTASQEMVDAISDAVGETDETFTTNSRTDSRFANSMSPLPTRDSQRFAPSRSESCPVDADILDSKVSTASLQFVQPRPENVSRPLSPTKGMGGFVQSAMLKRSDSVNKKWSVQTPSGLNRQDSVAGSRSGSRLSQDLSNGRDYSNGIVRTFGSPSKEPNSIALTEKLNSTPTTPPRHIGLQHDVLSTVKLPHHKRSLPALSGPKAKADQAEEPNSPPSPSKRWSPVKSSWLESALSKPSSPQLASSPSQPTWLSDLNKIKQARSSRDLSSISQAQYVSAEPLSGQSKSTSVENDHTLNRSKTVKSPPTKPKPSKLSSGALDEVHAERGITQPTEVERLSDLDNTWLLTPLHKVKPGVPTKTDLRSALKPPESTAEPAEKDELEFRNVFGKLKRAHTGKYTPPDELKDNILRSKAALSASEGPQSAAKKDDFKADLLKQRETVTANRAAVVRPALPGRKAFLPAESFVEKSKSETNTTDIVPNDENLRGSSPAVKSHSNESSARSSLAPTASTTNSNVQREGIINSKIATRFNPGLANLLAKRTAASGEPTNSLETSGHTRESEKDGSLTSNPSADANKAAQLQHMTKGRARGPKRRLPNAGGGSADVQTPAQTQVKTSPSLPIHSFSNASMASSDNPRTTVQTGRTVSETRFKPQTPPKPVSVARNSVSPQTSEENLSPATTRSSKSPSSLPSRPAKPSGLRSSSGSTPEPTVTKSEPILSSQQQNSDEVEVLVLSVKDATARWGRRTTSRSSGATEVKAPMKLPTLEDEQVDVADIDEKNDYPKNTDHRTSPVPRQNATAQEIKYTRSVRAPPKVEAKSDAVTRSFSSTSKTDDIPPIKPPRPTRTQASTSTRVFSDFFNEAPKIGSPLDMDTYSYLYTRPSSADKIKTLRRAISHMSSDGKTAPLPSHQDHVLFARSMYLCTHIFGDSTGARIIEVYLWVGNSVTDASIEETELFARKIAKDAGGKLIVFRQGKETTNFLQALGGILITRSGTATNNKKSYMLCGRRHLGHIAFDEVDFSRESLCSGFPFIVVSSNGTIFVWKGHGCNAEELAGARLMSMDLGITSTVVEVDEGQETPDFLSVFPSDTTTTPTLTQATYWKLKAKIFNYNIRLFRIEYTNTTQDTSTVTALWNRVRQADAAGPSKSAPCAQITEITPFCQADLDPENIYVLDAFFELFVILGPLATRKPSAFTTALLFTQDYAIQSASNPLENRPFVPPATVVLEGVPRDMKAVFRGWREELGAGTELLMAGRGRGGDGGIGRGVRTMSLGEAIDACR